MSKVIQIDKIEDTSLWKQLNKQNTTLAGNLVGICNEAAERMKAMSAYAPQYTLHDETHLLRTTELMSYVLGGTKLNTVELALLILSAFFHDQGMVPTQKKYETIQGDSDFQLFKDKWLVEYPNHKQIEKQLGSHVFSGKERTRLAKRLVELDNTMLTDYLRSSHAQRSADYVRSQYGDDKRLEIHKINLSRFVALLCKSHSLPVSNLDARHNFRFDEQIGTCSVNMTYLAVVLRLADILDLDRDRTPESLFKSIHFTSEVSLIEWEKHRSIQGWDISTDRIRFTMRSKHPVYEATARKFMDLIDAELSDCHELCKIQPQGFKHYQLELPIKVDRSRIEPLDNAYRYHDLEFHLSRDEIVRLLMTDKLYGHPHLCIRELLQNALDALRYRKALFSSAGNQWKDGRIELKHSADKNGYEVIECVDNGSGMDENILTNYFTKVGRSFYRSPEFERERAKFRDAGNDFDPCSSFGIGFMSCFMLGDRITIETRRDYGPGKKYGQPLVVEMHGLGGLMVIRDGKPDQPIGTKVTIFSRKKPAFLDFWTDKVRLVTVLKGYALATEFPIRGICTISEISDEVIIPPQPEPIPTFLEDAGIKKLLTIEQKFVEIDENLGGEIRESFLLDEDQIPCLANDEAKWCARCQGTNKCWALHVAKDGKIVNNDTSYDSPVCVDGILVAGPPGRASIRKNIRGLLGHRNSGIYGNGSALVDARGTLQPELTPGRIPPDHLLTNRPPHWQRLDDKVMEAVGRMWEKVLHYLNTGLSQEDFWKLALVYRTQVTCIRHQSLWDTLPVSLVAKDGECNWCKVRELGDLSIVVYDVKGFELHDVNEQRVRPSPSLEEWEKDGTNHPSLHWCMNTATLLMCSAQIRENSVVLTPGVPVEPNDMLAQYMVKGSGPWVDMFLLDYVGTAKDALAIETPFPSANRMHPLTKICHNSRYFSEKSDLETFAIAFVPCISKTVSSQKETPSLKMPRYWHKRVAYLYFEVDWARYDNNLKPPYKIWTSEKGWTEIGESDLACWRDSRND